MPEPLTQSFPYRPLLYVAVAASLGSIVFLQVRSQSQAQPVRANAEAKIQTASLEVPPRAVPLAEQDLRGPRKASVRGTGRLDVPLQPAPMVRPGADPVMPGVSAEDAKRYAQQRAALGQERLQEAKSAQARGESKESGGLLERGAGDAGPVATARLAAVGFDSLVGEANGRGPGLKELRARIDTQFERFTADADAYLNRIDPERVHDHLPVTKEPLADPLTADSPASVLVEEGDATELVVVTRPGAPATFLSRDGGRFDNAMNTITVRADAKGRATARWHALGGVHDAAQVEAASPFASGSVVFALEVRDAVIAEAPSSSVNPLSVSGSSAEAPPSS